jgi:hypothetical protein
MGIHQFLAMRAGESSLAIFMVQRLGADGRAGRVGTQDLDHVREEHLHHQYALTTLAV